MNTTFFPRIDKPSLALETENTNTFDASFEQWICDSVSQHFADLGAIKVKLLMEQAPDIMTSFSNLVIQKSFEMKLSQFCNLATRDEMIDALMDVIRTVHIAHLSHIVEC